MTHVGITCGAISRPGQIRATGTSGWSQTSTVQVRINHRRLIVAVKQQAGSRPPTSGGFVARPTERTVRTAALGLIRADPSPRVSNELARCLARTRVLVPSARPSCGQIDFFSDAGRQATGPSSRVLAEAMTSAEVVDLTPPLESGDNT